MADEFRSEEHREQELEDKLAATHAKEERLEHELDDVAREEDKIEEELEEMRHHHKHHAFKLIFIINGVDYPVHTTPDEVLNQAVEKALTESDNTGRREASEWEVRNNDGVLLDQGRSIKDLGLHDEEKLYLTLKVGAGG